MINRLKDESDIERTVPPFMSDHIKSTLPKMACGILIYKDRNYSYMRCTNIADNPTRQCKIGDEDYARARSEGDMIHTVIFRPDEVASPTEEDQAQCNKNKAPWMIISWPGLKIQRLLPNVEVPLTGRQFIHGTYDCYALVRDYYRMSFGISLKNYDRSYLWWKEGGNLFLENYKKEGFEEISAEKLRPGDLILMKIDSPVPNHIAIYLENGEILHHLSTQPSKREAYTDKWKDKAVLCLRHEKLSD